MTTIDAVKNSFLWKEKAFLEGTWCDAYSKETLEVTNPATGEVIGTIPAMGAAETEQAVQHAVHAFHHWRRTTCEERAALMEKWYQLICEHAEALAVIMTLEQGKPLAEAKGEVLYGASFVKWFSEEARRLYSTLIPPLKNNSHRIAQKQPMGVIGALTPWNFPSAMITRKVAPAIAAGCTVILKPSELTPFSALALAALAEKAGMPAGVLQLITGRPEAIGEVLTSHPKVAKISFTGSTRVGKLLLSHCASTVKPAALELGGNAPFIVMQDADTKAAVQGLIIAKARNTGQACISPNRIFIHEKIYDVFMAELLPAVQQLSCGDGFTNCQLGPLINDDAVTKIQGLLQEAVLQGATLVHQGKVPATGSFFPPTIITHIRPAMRIAQEEIFGPVIAISTFASEEEVLQLANATPVGLAAYLFCGDVTQGWRMAEHLHYGMVGVNDVALSHATTPFGGVKQSGIGHEGSFLGIEEYLTTQYISLCQ